MSENVMFFLLGMGPGSALCCLLSVVVVGALVIGWFARGGLADIIHP